MRSLIMFCLVSVLFFGCSAAQKAGDKLVDVVVDCTTAEAAKVIDEFRPVVVAAINDARLPTGDLDFEGALDRIKTFGVDTGACVVADVVGGIMAGRFNAAGVDMNSTEALTLFDNARARYWKRHTYKTDAGML